MATFTAVADGEIDQDSPLTVGLKTKGRDNPIAMSTRDATARAAGVIHAAGWTFVEDIFDYSVDGNTYEIESSSFEAWHEYLIVAHEITTDASTSLRIQLYRSTDAAFSSDIVITNIGSADTAYYTCELMFSSQDTNYKNLRISSHKEIGGAVAGNSEVTFVSVEELAVFTTAQRTGKVKVSVEFSFKHMNGGVISLYKRAI